MGSKLKETFVDPISRRQFLKTSGKGIMGAAASTAFPGGTGGIMETEAAKTITKSVPFEAQDFIGIAEMITDKGIKPK